MKRRAALVGCIALVLAPMACRSSKGNGSAAPPGLATAPNRQGNTAHSSAAGPNPAASLPAPPPPPEPLRTAEPLEPLPVEGFGAAVVSVPTGATAPRPVVVALHGNYDRPEWQCAVWREITRAHPWVLCPRGIPRSDAPKGADRWTFAGVARFEEELNAGLTALAAAYERYVDLREPVFTGFSLGAILGVHLLKRPESRYKRAVLVEGGYAGWGVAGARAFDAHGGEKLLIGCGQTACVHAGRQLERLFARGQVSVEVTSGGDAGHTYDGPVARAVAERWGWLVAGDPRFGAPAPESD